MNKVAFESLPLSAQVLCSKSVRKNDKAKDMLVNYYNALDEDEKESFDEYAQAFKLTNEQLSKNKYKIDKAAIIIAKRLKEELNIPCFPIVKRRFKTFFKTRKSFYPWFIVSLEKGDHIKKLHGVTRISTLVKTKNKLFTYSYGKKTLVDIE